MNKEINKILIAGTEYDIRDSRFDEASQAETDRQEAEQGRVTAEQQRADAEAARAEEFAGFSTAIAAKEDAVNKVTSIGADADDQHYPSAKAVWGWIGKGYQFRGIATPTTNPGTPDGPVFYLAAKVGVYPNFNNIEVTEGEAIIFEWNNGTWSKKVTGFATQEKFTELGSEVGKVTKNIVILDGTKTFAEQVTEENTIYDVRDVFDLGGVSLSIPSNCVLRFNGGKLANGTITGDNTSIDASIAHIFGVDVTLSGTWNVVNGYPEWFGAIGNDDNDDREAVQKCMDSFSVTILSKTYALKSHTEGIVLTLPSNKKLCGNTFNHPAINAFVNLKNYNNVDGIVCLVIKSGTEVSNISIDSITEVSNSIGLKSFGNSYTTNNKLFNVAVRHYHTCFDLQTFVSKIEGCHAQYCDTGFYIHQTSNNIGNPTTIDMSNCYCILARNHAYHFYAIKYSSFRSLAADGCGFSQYTSVVNSSSEVKYPYLFEYLHGCTFFALGAEKSLKYISAIQCKETYINGGVFAYGYNNNAQAEGSTYTPERICLFGYGCTITIDNIQVVADYSNPPANFSASNNYRLFCVENNGELNYVSVKMLGLHDDQIYRATNCYMYNASKSTYLENNKVLPSEYTTDKHLANALNEIDLDNNKNDIIKIILTKTQVDFAASYKNTFDLHGKTIIVESQNNNTNVTLWGEKKAITLRNGKIIFKNITFNASDNNTREHGFFVLENAELVLNGSIYRPGVLPNGYIFETDETSIVKIYGRIVLYNSSAKLAPFGKYSHTYNEMPNFEVDANSMPSLFEGTTILDGGIRYVADANQNIVNITKQVESLPTISGTNKSAKMIGCTFVVNGEIKFWTGETWRTL